MATKKKTKTTTKSTKTKVKKSKAKAGTKAKATRKTSARTKAKTTAKKKSTNTRARAKTTARKKAARTSVKSKSAVKKKSTRKTAARSKAKTTAKKKATRTKAATSKRTAKKRVSPVSAKKSETKSRAMSKSSETAATSQPASTPSRPPVKTRIRPLRTSRVSRSPVVSRDRNLYRMAHAPQFNYMKAPGLEHAFEVGDTVEVFCDHEKDSERVRGWIKGVVVQLDNKMVAVQFRSNVFLTDGWMVPDRILWYSLTSDQIRTSGSGRKGSRKDIPDY